MKKISILAMLIAGVFVVSTFADPIDLGTKITAYDKWSDNSSWHGAGEDQEIEPPDLQGQIWDLEGVFLKGSSLSMVGGFNFSSGQSDGVRTYLSGDIFIDIDGNAKYGSDLPASSANGYNVVKNANGWDYAISLNFSNNTYDVYKIDATTDVVTPYFGANRPSSPLELYNPNPLAADRHGSFTYLTGKSDADVGFLGGLHNIVQGIDLSFLGNTNFTTHFTMGCGNDMLIGKYSINVPEPGTFSLIGIGLLALVGLLGFRRKK
jgi:hypothetical protein